MTCIFFGAGSIILLEIIRGLENSGCSILAFSRQPNPFPGSTNLTWYEGDYVSQGLPLNLNPEKADGIVYFPCTINLRPFTMLNMEKFSGDKEINFLGMVRTLKSFVPALKNQATPLWYFSQRWQWKKAWHFILPLLQQKQPWRVLPAPLLLGMHLTSG